jgi:hypothetical protein
VFRNAINKTTDNESDANASFQLYEIELKKQLAQR